MTLSRDARKVETREALLRAAARLFARGGIEATSLDRIAAEVGLTKGAVYAHFSNKQELVFAVFEAFEEQPTLSRLIEVLLDDTEPLEQRLRAIAEAREEMASTELFGLSPLEVVLFDLEFFIYSLRDRDPEVLATTRRTYEDLGGRLEAIQRKLGEPLALPGATVVPLLVNLLRAFGIANAQSPDLVPPSTFVEIYPALAKLLTTRAREASGAPPRSRRRS